MSQEVEHHLHEYKVKDESGLPRVLYFFRDSFDRMCARIDHKETYIRLTAANGGVVTWAAAAERCPIKLSTQALEVAFGNHLSRVVVGDDPKMWDPWANKWTD